MPRFLTHLTLVAYLVGGWLLPAAHHHAPHVVSDGHRPHVSCCVTAAHDHESHDHEACHHEACHHEACHHEAEYQPAASSGRITCQLANPCDCGHHAVFQQRVIDTDTVIAPVQTHSHDCVGLCAGCVAQSLVGTHVEDQTPWKWIVNANRDFLADPRLVLSERYGFALSRGPPAAV